MAKTGPIVIVEDDSDDQEIIADVIKEVGIQNELIFFERCSTALKYLKSTQQQPFIIICDINLPEQSGLEFKKQVDEDPHLRQKSIPFIFLSTAADQKIVTAAYSEMVIQGYFQKTSSVEDLKNMLRVINEYWKLCKHPNSDF